MAGKKVNKQEKPQEVLVPSLAGNGSGESKTDNQEQVRKPSPLEALYEQGAEIVLTLTDAVKINYTITVAGEVKPLELTLPPGNWVFAKVKEPLAKKPGLQPVVNPRKA
jgi:hypothetical protein